MSTRPYALFVATPCYGGQVSIGYMNSMMKLQDLCSRMTIPLEIYNIPFESLIPRARNASISKFMLTECTHLLFIDADIEFDAQDVIKMIETETGGILCGTYPKKVLRLEEMKNNAENCNTLHEFVISGTRFALNVEPDTKHDENKIIEVKDAATGFMMIKRQIFEEMIRQYPETEYANDVDAYDFKGAKFYDLFQSRPVDGRYLSEDYGFCRLWQKIGGKVYIDLSIKLNHIGMFKFIGDPLALMNLKNRTM